MKLQSVDGILELVRTGDKDLPVGLLIDDGDTEFLPTSVRLTPEQCKRLGERLISYWGDSLDDDIQEEE